MLQVMLSHNCVHSVQQTQHHVLETPGDKRNRMQMIVHKKVRMLPDGRPVLQVLLQKLSILCDALDYPGSLGSQSVPICE